MQILMVSNYFDSHPGGIEAVAGQLFRRLPGPRCQVTWAAAGASAPPDASTQARVLSLNVWNGIEGAIGLPFPIPGPVSIARLWAVTGFSDVVLLHDCLYISNIAAFAFARLRRKPVLIVQHIGTVPFSNRVVASIMKMANALITRPMLRTAEQVAFISQITERHFRKLRFARSPVLVFNGTDTAVFRPSFDDSARASLRSALALPIDKPVALFVGRFVEKKGLPILARMAGLAPDIFWAFAGSGPLTPSDWGLPNVGVYSNLRGSRLADLYRACDVFVLPSTGEGFPLVIQEALACGLPVVCSAETATADDTLGKFVQGVALAPEHAQSALNFLSVIREILNRPVQAELAEQRFAFVESRYGWRDIVDRYLEIASELACKHGQAIRAHPNGSANAITPVGQDGESSEETPLCTVPSGSLPSARRKARQ